MGFAQENGYTPSSFNTLMNIVMAAVNTQFGTSYTPETFIGTNHYKYFYGPVQRLQHSEVKTSEIFLKVQDYIRVTNQRISRPVATQPGMIEKFAAEGFIASVKPMIEIDAGKRHVCVLVDDGVNAEGVITISNYANLVSGTDDSFTIGGTVFTAQAGAATPGDGTFQAATSNNATAASLVAQINAHATVSLLVRAVQDGNLVKLTAVHGGVGGNAITTVYTDNDSNVGGSVSGATLTGGADSASYPATRLEVCEIIANSTVGGVVTIGTEVETIVISNGQAFDTKFNLPNLIDTRLRLTITLSENNQFVIKTPEEIKAILLANIVAKYNLGKNFEPQRYFTVLDAPWAASVSLEYSHDSGATWDNAIWDADYRDLFDISLDNITVVEV